MKLNPRRIALASALLAVGLAGCDAVPPEYERDWLDLKKQWQATVIILTGRPFPEARRSARPSPGPSATADGEPLSRDAENAKANAEILHEVFRVVFMREPRDRSEFGSMVDSMNQGASIEGVHNGFTHSSDYRRLEMANPVASAEALHVFGEELAVLESEFPKPAEFTAAAARPLALPVQPEVQDRAATSAGVQVIEYGKPLPTPSSSDEPKVDPKILADQYSRTFVGASIFTLKRVMADEALRVIASKKDYREKLALWYSNWVVHMCARGVDFGIPLRNKPDGKFHSNWAHTADPDRLTWEVLNRTHRVLNEANRQKQ